ncbi:hypothetical protein SKAU_G00031340 [Synaphobranchus kaupii]|uniref:Uncharacterized protein n=1 Tax=Synaphobranchus kaupii TaxID=118154 RepID=A0A9Q1GF13_SYNKA|nr:hypothetical protein SKAU_G00031340 [Synaphobranchus kaupii]
MGTERKRTEHRIRYGSRSAPGANQASKASVQPMPLPACLRQSVDTRSPKLPPYSTEQTHYCQRPDLPHPLQYHTRVNTNPRLKKRL